MKFKRYLVLKVLALLFFNTTAIWGSSIATLADLEQNKKQEQYKSGDEYIKILEKKLVGEGFFEAQERRKQEVEQKVKQKIEEDQVIQLKVAEIRNSLNNPSYDAAARKVISDKEKKIREEVENSIPKVEPKGLRGEMNKFFEENDKKWAKIPEQMKEINRRDNEALYKRRKDDSIRSLMGLSFILCLFGVLAYMYIPKEKELNNAKEIE